MSRGTVFRLGLFGGLFSVFALGSPPVCLSDRAEKSRRELFSGAKIGEPELLARLVFAEGISTNFENHAECRELGPEIFEAIAYGVMNRARLGEASVRWAERYGKGLSGVIFKEGQFNPAVSRRSRFGRYFLCPGSYPAWRTLWPLAVAAADRAIRLPARNPFLHTPWEKRNQLSLVSHFYYPRSEQATPKPPAWADASARSKTLVRRLTVNGKTIPASCLWFFRLESP